MLAEIGFISLVIAFVAAIYAIVASIYGDRVGRNDLVLSGRNASLLTFGMLTVSTSALFMGLMTQDYQISYVWSVSSPSMPTFFRATSLWGSQAGSLLFWSFLLSGFTAVAIAANWKPQRRLMPYVVAYSMAVLVFFLGLSIFIENPFDRYWIVNGATVKALLQPAGGSIPPYDWLSSTAQGLNPLLRHFGMAIHPPMLYLGFVGFVIPFAFAMAALASGDLSTNWIKATRRWTLVAWLFLSLGLLLGGRWAYDVLGWGGYWGWDPVENAAFLPWLIGTAFLHSVMIQEKRGMLKTWNMFLIIGTFSAVIFGTFATRSGLVESVHSFARSGIGFPMFFFWFILTLISVSLILWRRSQGLLRDDHAFGSVFSRESLFVVNNFVFVALFIAIFWGSFGAPITSELLFDTNITLGIDYFNRVTMPLFALMYILMGIAPLSAWTVTSVRRLGKSILVPIAFTVLTVLAFAAAGMDAPMALFAYGIVSLAGWVAIYEGYRAIAARVQTHKESYLAAFNNVLRRNPRRYGGYLIHLGVTIIGIGVIGSNFFQVETQRTIAVGDSVEIAGYVMTYDRFDAGQIAQDGRILDIANVTVSRNGRELARLRPRRDYFPETNGLNTMTIAGAYSTLENDFYVLVVGGGELSDQVTTFKIYVNPLVNLVWWGGLILIAGTILAIYPKELLAVNRVRELTSGRGLAQRV